MEMGMTGGQGMHGHTYLQGGPRVPELPERVVAVAKLGLFRSWQLCKALRGRGAGSRPKWKWFEMVQEMKTSAEEEKYQQTMSQRYRQYILHWDGGITSGCPNKRVGRGFSRRKVTGPFHSFDAGGNSEESAPRFAFQPGGVLG